MRNGDLGQLEGQVTGVSDDSRSNHHAPPESVCHRKAAMKTPVAVAVAAGKDASPERARPATPVRAIIVPPVTWGVSSAAA